MLEKSHGTNKKGLLVTISTGEIEAMTPFLAKILSAIKFELSKDALLLELTNKDKWSFMDLCHMADKPIEKAIFFGQSPNEVGLNIVAQKYTLVHVGGKTLMFADSLTKISEDATVKKLLWGQLQVMFGLKA